MTLMTMFGGRRMIDTDKYERMTMNDMEHLELWEFSRKLFAEVKRLRGELKFVVEMLEGKPSDMEWYECRNLILEQVVIE